MENTDLHIHLDTSVPSPLMGSNVNNTITWVLAFAPLIGYFVEWIVAYAIHKNSYQAEAAMGNNKYWFLTLALNIGLGFWDESVLKKAGHDTRKLKGFVWLVPVYLFQRAKALKQTPAYFYVWLVCFAAVLFA